jgi:NADP-dependent 3-hydroxy acid dehydrogenase YdfG
MVSAQEVLAVIGGAAGLVTAIWYAAMYVGKMTVTIARHEDRLDDHEARLSKRQSDRGMGQIQ